VRRLRQKRVWLPLVLVAGLVIAATARWFVWPATDAVDHADAVVVFDGGRGERLREARALMARGIAPTLVVSAGRELDADDGDGLCVDPPPFEVVCFTPRPDTTRGEARALAEIARGRDWDTVALVTSTYHVSRARMLVERCYGGRLDVIAASPPANPAQWVANLAHEWGGAVDAMIDRDC
jgi:uncharacterized SAM-binding protein YcdF (DUF218 family)